MDLDDLVENPLFGDIIQSYLDLLAQPVLPPQKTIISELQIALVERAMILCRGNKAAVARILGIKRTTLIEMFRKKDFKLSRIGGWGAHSNIFGNDKRSYNIDRRNHP